MTEHLDSGSAPVILRHPSLAAAVQRAVSSSDPLHRAEALKVVGRVLLAAPVELSPGLVPLLVTAAVHEVGAVQEQAVASLADVAYLLARSSPQVVRGSAVHETEPEDAAASTLVSVIELLQSFLYAPAVELQQIAVLGLAKLLVDPVCNTSSALLLECTDPESIVAELGYRYTTKGSLDTKKGGPAAMSAILLLFEVLAKERLMLLSNAVIWTCLGAAEDANSKDPCGTFTLEEHTLRCVRFLFGTLPGGTMPQIVTAVRLNLQMQQSVLLSDAVISEWIGQEHM